MSLRSGGVRRGRDATYRLDVEGSESQVFLCDCVKSLRGSIDLLFRSDRADCEIHRVLEVVGTWEEDRWSQSYASWSGGICLATLGARAVTQCHHPTRKFLQHQASMARNSAIIASLAFTM